MGKQRILKKNGRLHTEGEPNIRACKCKHCGQKIEASTGHKLIIDASFCFVHRGCLDMINGKGLMGNKVYKHGIIWRLRFKPRKQDIKSLVGHGWSVTNGIATITTTTLNNLTILKHSGYMDLKVMIDASNNPNIVYGQQSIIGFALMNIEYNKLRDVLVLRTKELIKGDNREYTTFPDFIKIC